MTVQDLIDHLQTMDNRNLRVVVNGYEGGYADLTPKRIRKLSLALNQNHSRYFGPHELANECLLESTDVVEDAVVLSRGVE